MTKPYVYALIRKDISHEQQMVQVAHAALEAGFRFKMPDQVASLIVLEVANKEELELAAERLHGYGIDHHMFFEPDWEMGHSAIATRPIIDKKERHLFRKWNLYNKGVFA